MTLKIHKNGSLYRIVCLGGVTISGSDLEALKRRASYMYRIFDNSIQWEIVEE